MNKITRYLFILICLVAFLVLAPLIVFYVSGTSVDDNGEYRQTGIFTVETEPDNAKLKIDNRNPVDTPATIRFLPQSEYGITISKEGYFDWYKRLLVETGKVTYGQQGLPKINLIKLPAPQVLVNDKVASFVLSNNTIWFGAGSKIGYFSLSDSTKVTYISAPINVRSLTTLRNKNFLLATDDSGHKLLINQATKSVLQLPDSLNSATDIYVSDDDILLARVGTTIKSYDFKTKVGKDQLTNVAGFTLLGSTAYIANQTNEDTTLQAIDWDGNTFTDAEPILNTSLPNSKDIKLFITDRKELFAQVDEILYRINSKPEVISTHVANANLDYSTNELTFRTSTELWFYNFLISQPQLLTRNTSTINDYKIRSELGYGFTASATGLDILEIDSRYQQNHYVLLKDKPVWAFAISSNLKTVVALQDDQLLVIPIR